MIIGNSMFPNPAGPSAIPASQPLPGFALLLGAPTAAPAFPANTLPDAMPADPVAPAAFPPSPAVRASLPVAMPAASFQGAFATPPSAEASATSAASVQSSALPLPHRLSLLTGTALPASPAGPSPFQTTQGAPLPVAAGTVAKPAAATQLEGVETAPAAGTDADTPTLPLAPGAPAAIRRGVAAAPAGESPAPNPNLATTPAPAPVAPRPGMARVEANPDTLPGVPVAPPAAESASPKAVASATAGAVARPDAPTELSHPADLPTELPGAPDAPPHGKPPARTGSAGERLSRELDAMNAATDRRLVAKAPQPGAQAPTAPLAAVAATDSGSEATALTAPATRATPVPAAVPARTPAPISAPTSARVPTAVSAPVPSAVSAPAERPAAASAPVPAPALPVDAALPADAAAPLASPVAPAQPEADMAGASEAKPGTKHSVHGHAQRGGTLREPEDAAPQKPDDAPVQDAVAFVAAPLIAPDTTAVARTLGTPTSGTRAETVVAPSAVASPVESPAAAAPVASASPTPVGKGDELPGDDTGSADGSPFAQTPRTAEAAPRTLDPHAPHFASEVQRAERSAAPAAPATLSAPGTAHAPDPTVNAQPGVLGRGMAVEISRSIAAGDEQLHVRLNPAELGRVEVRIGFDDSGTLQATMRTDTHKAMELLRNDSADLGRALDQAGVRADAGSFRFESRDGGNGGQPFARQPAPERSALPTASEPDPLPEPARRPILGNGAVDLLA